MIDFTTLKIKCGNSEISVSRRLFESCVINPYSMTWSNSGWWAGLDPNSLPQELWHGFSASWESSICERKLHYPGNRTQNLLLSGEISYHTSVCWVKKWLDQMVSFIIIITFVKKKKSIWNPILYLSYRLIVAKCADALQIWNKEESKCWNNKQWGEQGNVTNHWGFSIYFAELIIW